MVFIKKNRDKKRNNKFFLGVSALLVFLVIVIAFYYSQKNPHFPAALPRGLLIEPNHNFISQVLEALFSQNQKKLAKEVLMALEEYDPYIKNKVTVTIAGSTEDFVRFYTVPKVIYLSAGLGFARRENNAWKIIYFGTEWSSRGDDGGDLRGFFKKYNIPSELRNSIDFFSPLGNKTIHTSTDKDAIYSDSKYGYRITVPAGASFDTAERSFVTSGISMYVKPRSQSELDELGLTYKKIIINGQEAFQSEGYGTGDDYFVTTIFLGDKFYYTFHSDNPSKYPKYTGNQKKILDGFQVMHQ